jgi:hypothetical protein
MTQSYIGKIVVTIWSFFASGAESANAEPALAESKPTTNNILRTKESAFFIKKPPIKLKNGRKKTRGAQPIGNVKRAYPIG